MEGHQQDFQNDFHDFDMPYFGAGPLQPQPQCPSCLQNLWPLDSPRWHEEYHQGREPLYQSDPSQHYYDNEWDNQILAQQNANVESYQSVLDIGGPSRRPSVAGFELRYINASNSQVCSSHTQSQNSVPAKPAAKINTLAYQQGQGIGSLLADSSWALEYDLTLPKLHGAHARGFPEAINADLLYPLPSTTPHEQLRVHHASITSPRDPNLIHGLQALIGGPSTDCVPGTPPEWFLGSEPSMNVMLYSHKSQSMCRSKRTKRRFTNREKAIISLKRKVGVCRACRQAKRKCTHITPNLHEQVSTYNKPTNLGPDSSAVFNEQSETTNGQHFREAVFSHI